ncbi:MAG: OmpH family outer membrane protein [Longimicrobiales bacterium]|nr:OmpH family outer membrane protein [Longimicrobiales bacterium]
MRRVVAGILAVAAFTASPVWGQAPLKVGFINSQFLLDQAPGAAQAAQQFDQELGQMRQQLQPMATELDSLISQFEAQSLTLSEEARRQRQQTILQKQGQLQQAAQAMEQQAEQRRSELVQPIMDRISRTIEAIRVEGAYHIIFDVAAGSIIAADPTLDLTQEVLRRLQAGAAGAAGAPRND